MTELTAHNSPLSTDGISDDKTPTTPPQETPRFRRILKNVGWVALGLFCLTLFTLLKLPEDRIKNYVQGMIAAQLAPKGISLTSERGYLSLGWGISYVMKDVTLSPPSPEAPAKIDKVSFTPSLIPMIFGYQGGTLWVYQGDGHLSASVSLKNTQISGSFKAKNMDLGKIGVLSLAAGVKGSMVASGAGSFSGDLSIPSTLTGEVELNLSKIVIDQQSIAGFSVPKLGISEGILELNADKGKATIKTLRLGKAGNAAEDLQGSATGDVMLGRTWPTSTVNARLNFRLSQNVTKAFAIVTMLLKPGEQADGSFTYTLSGPLTMPQFLPVAPGAN